MIDNLTCYVITSGVYYIERNKMNSFTKTKAFSGGCIFTSKDLAEQVVKNLYEQDVMQLTFKNLQIHEYSLVKGILSSEEKAQYKTPKKKSTGRPKKQNNIELLTARLNELNVELGLEENLQVLEVATNKEAHKVIENIVGDNIKVSFVSKKVEYVAEITFNDDTMDLVIMDKESYVEDFGEEGIV